MGPPPYGRSQTVPYHKPLSVMERKQSQEQQMLANQAGHKSNMLYCNYFKLEYFKHKLISF